MVGGAFPGSLLSFKVSPLERWWGTGKWEKDPQRRGLYLTSGRCTEVRFLGEEELGNLGRRGWGSSLLEEGQV